MALTFVATHHNGNKRHQIGYPKLNSSIQKAQRYPLYFPSNLGLWTSEGVKTTEESFHLQKEACPTYFVTVEGNGISRASTLTLKSPAQHLHSEHAPEHGLHLHPAEAERRVALHADDPLL